MKHRKLAAIAVFTLGLGLMAEAQTAENSEPPEAPEDLVRRFLAAFNAQDASAMVAMVTEDVEWLMVDGPKVTVETQGKENLRTGMEGYFKSCPSCRSEVRGFTTTGSRVSCVEVASWQTPGGAKSQSSLAVYELAAGKIRRVYYFPVER